MESATLGKAVATMIENAPRLFTIPQELSNDVANFWKEMENPNIAVFDDTKADRNSLDDKANIQKAKVCIT